MRRFRWVLLGLAVSLLGGVGCADIKGSFEDSMRSSAEINSKLGSSASLAIETKNDVTTVTVTLAKPPADAAAAKQLVTEIVKRNFRTKVAEVTMVY